MNATNEQKREWTEPLSQVGKEVMLDKSRGILLLVERRKIVVGIDDVVLCGRHHITIV